MNTNVIDGEILPVNRHDRRSFDGVLTKRVVAFLFDYIFIAILLLPAALIVALLGILTLGLGWMLFAVLGPLVALSYIALTLGGRQQSTWGMRAMGIRLERLDGRPIDGLTAIVHTVMFWAFNTILTPLVLLVTLFSDQKRTLHDLLLGTVVARST